MTSSTETLTDLPREVQLSILQYLPPRDLCCVALCSRSWREIANQNILWRRLCRRRGWERFGTTQDICKAPSFVPASPKEASPNVAFPMDAVVTGSEWPELVATCKWKEVYMKASHLEANWENNRYHTVSFEFGAAGYLGGCYEMPEFESSDPNKTRDLKVYSLDGEGDCLAAGLSNGTLKLWDMSTGKCRHIIRVPVTDAMHTVKIKNGIVAVGCTDGQTRTYSAETGEQLRAFWGHQWKVTHVFFDGEIIVSTVYSDPVLDDYDEDDDDDSDNQSDNDNEGGGQEEEAEGNQVAQPGAKESDIRVFGSKDDASDLVLCYRSGNSPLIYTDFHNKIVASAYKDKVICLWDAQNGTRLHTIKSDVDRLVSCYLGSGFVIGTNDSNNPVLKTWDLSSGNLLDRLDFPDDRLLDKTIESFMVNSVVTYKFDPDLRFLVACSRMGAVGAFGLDGTYIGDTFAIKTDDQHIFKLLLSCVHGNKIVGGDLLDSQMFLLSYSKEGGVRLVQQLRSKMYDEFSEVDDNSFNRAWMGPTKLAFPIYYLDEEELKEKIQVPKIFIQHYW